MMVRPSIPVFFLFAGLIGYAPIVGLFVTIDTKLAIVAAVVPLLIWVITADKKNCLYLFILMLPYSSSSFMSQNVMGISGMKPFNLLGIMTMAACLFHGGSLVSLSGQARNKALIYFWIFFAIFTLTVLRTLDYLPILHMFWPRAYSTSVTRFLLSYYMVPALYLVSFIYTLNLITTKEEIEKVLFIFWLSIILLSSVFIMIALTHFDIFLSGDRRQLVQLCGTFFGLHYNSIGSFYIIAGPLLLLPVLNGKWWGWVGFGIALIAILLLQSRTTIGVFLFGNCFLLYLLGRKKLLISLLLITGAAISVLLPLFLLKTLETGINPGDTDLLVSLFNGRIELLWTPLLSEWFYDPALLLFGKGRFSLIASDVYQRGIVIQTAHPHNALIELFLDCGLVVISGFLFFLFVMIKKAWQVAAKINTEIGWGLMVSILCFLIGTISGRTFYPSIDNLFLFVTLPLFINYVALESKMEDKAIEIKI